MSKKAMRASSGLAAALAVLVSGCSLDIFNPGTITDASLNDASLMGVVTAGVANEFNNLVDGLNTDIVRLSDEMAGTGSYFTTGRRRRGAMDWDETAGEWGQIHETIWTGDEALIRMAALDDFNQATSPLTARVYLLMGFAHRFFGDNFCEVVYNDGGVQNRTAAHDSAIDMFNSAITVGNAAGGSLAAGYVMAARAGLAQTYAAKGEWATAVTWSTQVPDDFIMSSILNRTSNSNIVYFETWQRGEFGLFNTYAVTMAGIDPRAPYTICGTFDDPATPKDSDTTPTGLCEVHQGSDGVTAHIRQDKYDDWGSDVPVATGEEMRLIEAEEALLRNDLTTFTARINTVRSLYSLAPIAEPATAGTLEYPNVYDASTGGLMPGANAADMDGWSILDGERHMTLWLEVRRFADLGRWDHPFNAGGIVFWDAEPIRVSCYPVPELECDLNETLTGATLLTGIGNGTHTCG